MDQVSGDPVAQVTPMRTLGTVRLRNHETNELILVPTPSNDPNDPLNWYVSNCINKPFYANGYSQVTSLQVLYGSSHMFGHDDEQLSGGG